MLPGGDSGAVRAAENVCADPANAVSRWKLLSGRKAVGVVPIHAPEEMAHAAGLLPVTVWGFAGRNGGAATVPSFLCPVVRGIFHEVRGPLGDLLDALVVPSTCDTLQNAFEVLRLEEGNRPLFPFVFPASRTLPGAAEYLLDRMEAFREWIGEVAGCPVSEGALERSIRVYAENRRRFRLLERRMAESPGYLRATEFDLLARSGLLMPKETHSELLEAVLARRKPASTPPRGKLFLSGMAVPEGLMETIDRAGAVLVGNDLAWGHRYYGGPEPEGGDPLLSLVRRHLGREPCSTLHDGAAGRPGWLVEQALAAGADRILLVRVRRCEPEGGDLPEIERTIRARGIPVLCIDTDLSGRERDALAVRIEAFLEMGE
ncbi:MAG: (R)-2-hydroxyisocaproyl-CoA dehydratase subunit beta [Deltaproteobacteria bacterium]